MGFNSVTTGVTGLRPNANDPPQRGDLVLATLLNQVGGRTQQVATLADRDNLPVDASLNADGLSSGSRAVGMLVYVAENNVIYKLDIPGWNDLAPELKLAELSDDANWIEFDADFRNIIDVDSLPSSVRWAHYRARTADLILSGAEVLTQLDISGNNRDLYRTVIGGAQFATNVTAGVSTNDEVAIIAGGAALRRENGSGNAVYEAIPANALILVFGRQQSTALNAFSMFVNCLAAIGGASRIAFGSGANNSIGSAQLQVQQADDSANAARWFSTSRPLYKTNRGLWAATIGRYLPLVWGNSHPESVALTTVGTGDAVGNPGNVCLHIGGVYNTGGGPTNVSSAYTEILILDLVQLRSYLNPTRPVRLQEEVIQAIFNFYKFVRQYDF